MSNNEVNTKSIKKEKNTNSHGHQKPGKVSTSKDPSPTTSSSPESSPPRVSAATRATSSGSSNSQSPQTGSTTKSAFELIKSMNPSNFQSVPLGGVNPLMYMNPMLLGNPQLAMNPLMPSLANQIAANQLLANQMMLRQFLMSGAGQMYPQPPMVPGNPAAALMATEMQQLVAKRGQVPPNVNLFQPQETEPMGFHGDQQKQVSLSGKRKSPSSSSNSQSKRPRVEGEVPNSYHDDMVVRPKRAEEEIVTKKKKNNGKQSKMLAGKK